MMESVFQYWSVPMYTSIIYNVISLPLLFKKVTSCDPMSCVIGHSQNMCSMVSIELEQKSHKFEFFSLHVNKCLLVGSMRCSILNWKLLKTMPDVALKGNIYACFQSILFEYISMIVSHLASCFVLLIWKSFNYLMTLFVLRAICNLLVLLSSISLPYTHRFLCWKGMLLIKDYYTRKYVAVIL